MLTDLIVRDRLLVERCLAGDQSAWSEMYQCYHAAILASIRAYLGHIRNDLHLLDEISARVWFALIRNDCELLARFDVSRGCRLVTFISVLAKAEARLLLRSERRLKARERTASRPDRSVHSLSVYSNTVVEEEFKKTLTPAERAYYSEELVSQSSQDSKTSFTKQNAWQLRHRIRKKLGRFMEE